MSSPRVRRRSDVKRPRVSTPSTLRAFRQHFAAEHRTTAHGAFDSGLNDSDLQLAGLDISWTEDEKKSPTFRSSTPESGARPTGAPQVLRSLKERMQARMEANARANSTRPEEKEEEERILSLDTQQAAFVHRRLEQEEDFFGLPQRVKSLLQELRGISRLYDWQQECLTLPGVEAGRNLVYSLPTSGGKTLVAEILILKQLLCLGKDVLLVLPYVSIVQEKVAALTPFGLALDFLVEEYAASRGRLPPTARRRRKSVYVATIEKAHALVNSLIAERRLTDLGLVVVDELHMIGEGGMRGAALEMTITKLLAASPSTRLVGMSATLSNIEDLCKFMDADLYTSDFRPVQLREFVKVEEVLFEIDNSCRGALSERLIHSRVLNHPYTREMRRLDPDCIAGLVSEVVPQHSCLIFCPTKRQCENLAELLVRLMPAEMGKIRAEERRGLLERLSAAAEGQVCPVLAKTMPMGVAYHHSGLTADERKAVEEAFSTGAVYVLCCTSTLAAGVNLPAKRVILRSPYVGSRFLTPSEYRQMIGRAGRAGLDSAGESVVILRPQDRKQFAAMIASSLNACDSSLLCGDGRGLQLFILSALTLELATDLASVRDLLSRSLLARQESASTLSRRTEEELQTLMDADLVEQVSLPDQAGPPRLRASALGRASVRGAVDPQRSARVVDDLRLAQHSLNMTSHLHLLYLITPHDLAEGLTPDWNVFYRRLESLTASEVNLLALIGLPEAYVVRKASGHGWRKPIDELVVRRAYLSLLLFDLWRQESVWTVSDRYGLPRGFVQQALASAAASASSLAHFVAEFPEFWCYQDVLPAFAKRLAHCANVELLPLMELPGVKRARARQLFEAGYRTLAHVAHAETRQLVAAVEHLSRRAAHQMVACAKMLLAEQADTLMEEAQRVLAVPENHDDSDLFA